jgi:hypothetical protein
MLVETFSKNKLFNIEFIGKNRNRRKSNLLP